MVYSKGTTAEQNRGSKRTALENHALYLNYALERGSRE